MSTRAIITPRAKGVHDPRHRTLGVEDVVDHYGVQKHYGKVDGEPGESGGDGWKISKIPLPSPPQKKPESS